MKRRPVVRVAIVGGLLAASMVGPTSVAAQDSSVPPLAAPTPPAVRTAGVLSLGADFAAAPQQFIEDDIMKGMNVELCTELAARLGLEVEWTNLTFSGLIPGLIAGQYDGLCTSVFITYEREQVMNMIPYTKWGTTLLIPAANPLGISCEPGDFDTCWRQMAGHSVAISKGGPQTAHLEAINEMLVGEGLEPLEVLNFDGIVQADQALVNGQVDSVYEDDTHAHYFATVTHPGMFTAAFTGRLPNELSLTTTLENTALAEAIQAGLESMAADGTYQRIMEDWGAIPLDEFPINPPRQPAATPTPAPSAP